jgi:hypothetical protein
MNMHFFESLPKIAIPTRFMNYPEASNNEIGLLFLILAQNFQIKRLHNKKYRPDRA